MKIIYVMYILNIFLLISLFISLKYNKVYKSRIKIYERLNLVYNKDIKSRFESETFIKASETKKER